MAGLRLASLPDRIRLSDREHELFQALVNYTGAQKASVVGWVGWPGAPWGGSGDYFQGLPDDCRQRAGESYDWWTRRLMVTVERLMSGAKGSMAA